MVQSAYEWHGPFKYHRSGEGFEYKGKYFLTEYGRRRWAEREHFDVLYADDELYARHLRQYTGAQIFDELPEGWHVGIYFHGGRRGLRGPNDFESAYEWCETDVPMYRNAYPGDTTRNSDYRQGLVRRQ